MSFRRSCLLAACVLTLSSCSDDGGGGGGPTGPSGAEPANLALQPVASGLSLPVLVTSPPGDHRLFIVEQSGAIRVFKNGALLPTPFLDVSGELTREYEQGLLGLAFDPQYATNGRFYIWLTVDGSPDKEQLRRYQVSGNPDVANPSGTTLLTFDRDQPEHNGGMIEFGPDGMLYASVGDGGSDFDAEGRGQSKTDLFGSILRLDVRGPGLVIPADNPFTGPGERRELWNIGLRNPWRFSIDRGTGDMYIGDVGENTYEEINIAPAAQSRGRGFNFGWRVLEGNECTDAPCDIGGKVLPALTYSHANGCCVIGGYVYRGNVMPGLRGRYFYADYCGRWVRSFRWYGGVTNEKEWTGLATSGNIMSFGQDAAGELYVCTEGGSVFRIVPDNGAVATGVSAAR